MFPLQFFSCRREADLSCLCPGLTNRGHCGTADDGGELWPLELVLKFQRIFVPNVSQSSGRPLEAESCLTFGVKHLL